MPEKNIFNDGFILISDKRFCIGSKVYPINNISSANITVTRPNRIWEFLFFVLGVLIFVGKFKWNWDILHLFWYGVGCIAFSILIFMLRKNVYDLVISTSGGELQALQNKNKQYIYHILVKLNDAIIMRS